MRFVNVTQPGNRLGMPLEAWPIADQNAWKAALVPGDLLDEPQDGSEFRPATRITMETCYARWLAWLKDNEPSVLDLSPGARATRDRVVAYLKALRITLKLRTVFNYGARLKRTLELLVPDHDWSWFKPLLGQLERAARAHGGTRPKPTVPAEQLYAFGVAIMKEAAQNHAVDNISQAEAYRDGLMIASLASRPIRLGNMLGLQNGSNFAESKNGEGFEVSLPDKLTKTKVDLEFAIPSKLVPYMQRYLTQYRNVLLAGPYGVAAGYIDQADYLWLARSGRQFPVASFEDMISRRTTERFGIRLTPHLFRDCVATSIAEHNPEDFHIIRIILGHSTIATAQRYYIHAKNLRAVRAVQKNLIDLRNQDRNGKQHVRKPLAQKDGAMMLARPAKGYRTKFS